MLREHPSAQAAQASLDAVVVADGRPAFAQAPAPALHHVPNRQCSLLRLDNYAEITSEDDNEKKNQTGGDSLNRNGFPPPPFLDRYVNGIGKLTHNMPWAMLSPNTRPPLLHLIKRLCPTPVYRCRGEGTGIVHAGEAWWSGDEERFFFRRDARHGSLAGPCVSLPARIPNNLRRPAATAT